MGKSPLLAALCIIEFVGPCRFSHFDDFGNAVGKPVASPWVQIAATALHQTANTLDMVRGMLVESPLVESCGLDVGKLSIQFTDGRPGKIEPVTAASASLEGGRPTFAVLDETHHWTESNGGHRVAEVIDRNIRKNPGGRARYVESTNAYNPNEDSSAQRTHEAVRDGAMDVLYDCVEAPVLPIGERPFREFIRTESDLVKAALRESYGDSVWVDVDSIYAAMIDPRTSIANALRFYLNQVAEGADTWIPADEWASCYDDADPIQPGDAIAIGFDGSIRNDSTGLVGCRLRDGRLFLLGLWECPEGAAGRGWEVDPLAVEAAFAEAFATYDVQWAYCDPPYWQDIIGRWAIEYGQDRIFEFWTNRPTQMARAVERFSTAVAQRGLSHDGDADLSRHVLNAVTREVPQGLLITKDSPKSKRKIDLAVCAVLAYEGRADALEDGRGRPRRRGRVVGF